VGRLDVEEFDAHADAGLHDANDDEGLEDLVFASESEAGAGAHGKRLAGTDKATTHGNIGRDAFSDLTGFEVEDFGISSKWVTKGIPAIAHSTETWSRGPTAFWHRDDLAHERISTIRNENGSTPVHKQCYVRTSL
jgi:hypothetical protein